MQAFANIFVRLIHDHGGEVHFGQAVRRIRVEDGAARGVELANGEFSPARWVISAADLRHYDFNPRGVPTAIITAWCIVQEILKK